MNYCSPARPPRRSLQASGRHQRSAPLSRWEAFFAKKPYLACIDCNTGWMHGFEDEMLKFSKPLFTSLDTTVQLDKTTQRVLAVWISLITILAEYLEHKTGICISDNERNFVKTRLLPPENWTIVACSQTSQAWYAKYRHHSNIIAEHGSRAEYLGSLTREIPNNCQISSFGMGKLFVQVFSSPYWGHIQDYRIAARSSGFNQIWPIPRRFWPLPKRFAKFPTETVLNEEQATFAADSFNERLKRMTKFQRFEREA